MSIERKCKYEDCQKSFFVKTDKNPKLFCSIPCYGKNQRKLYCDKNIYSNKIPSGTVGAIHELIVCCDLMRKGFDVYRSLSQSCPCDLAVVKDGKLLRIEVTTAHKSSTGKNLHPSKDTDNFDILALAFHDGKIEYIPTLESA